jgi:hypothetical protein
MTCLFNARAYRDAGSAAAPRRSCLDGPGTPHTGYWDVVGLCASTSCLMYRARGFRDGAPRARVCRRPSLFLFPAGPGVGPGWVRGGSGVGPGPVPRGPIWDPIGGCDWTRLPYEVMRQNPPSWGFWAGRSPATSQGAAQRRRGGRRGGDAPAPAVFAQLLGGRGPLGLPGGPNGPKNGLLCGTQRDDTSSRRVERGA